MISDFTVRGIKGGIDTERKSNGEVKQSKYDPKKQLEGKMRAKESMENVVHLFLGDVRNASSDSIKKCATGGTTLAR